MLKGGCGLRNRLCLIRVAGQTHLIGLLRMLGGRRPEQWAGRSVNGMAEAALAGLGSSALVSISQIRPVSEVMVASQPGDVTLVTLAADPIGLDNQKTAVVCPMRIMAGRADQPVGTSWLGSREREQLAWRDAICGQLQRVPERQTGGFRCAASRLVAGGTGTRRIGRLRVGASGMLMDTVAGTAGAALSRCLAKAVAL